MTALDKMAPWELEKLLNAINVVRDLLIELADETTTSGQEVEVYDNALLAMKLLELEVRIARAQE